MAIRTIISRYQKMPLPAKAAIWFTICNFFVKGISFVSAPLFSSLLSEEEYGKLTLFMSYEQIIMIICTWEIHIGAYQKGIFKFKEQTEEYTASTLLLENAMTIAAFCVIYCINGLLFQATGIPLYAWVALMFYILCYPGYYMWLIRNRKEYQYKKIIIGTVLFSAANLIVPYLAVIFIEKSAQLKFTATLTVSAVISLVFCTKSYVQAIKGKARGWKLFTVYNLHFAAPLVLHSLSYLMLNQADRIMIGNMVGNVQAGYYGVAYTVASIAVVFQTSINQSLTPWRYQMLEDKKYQHIDETDNKILLAIGGIIILFILIAPDIISILFSANYHEAIWCIPPISCSLFFVFLYSIFVSVESYFEKTQYVMYVSVTCGVINIILNYFGIKLFGYIACGYTTLISYILFCLGHYIFMQKVLKEQKITNYLNTKFIIVCSIIVTGLSIMSTLLYYHSIIRYSFIAACMIAGFIKRRELFSILHMIKRKE